MRIETVAQMFASYRAAVIPPNAPAIQILECERAFYAATHAVLMNLAFNVGDESTSEEEGVLELERLRVECEAYAARQVAADADTPAPIPPDNQPRYTVPDPAHIEGVLKTIGGTIRDALPEGWGFTLLIFSYGEHGATFYLSTADRAETAALLREFIRRQTQ